MRLVAVLLPVLLAAACTDDPVGAPQDSCHTPAGPLLGCVPSPTPDQPLSIEDACWRLVDCGVVAIDGQGNRADWHTCVNDLRGDDVPAERLRFILECITESTCQDLAEDHCVDFGSDNPR
jgi:hypothetical protein